MNTKIFILTLVSVLALSCAQEKDLEITGENLTENDLDICTDTKCPEITINYLKVNGNNDAAQKINDKIEHFITSTLAFGEDEKPAETVEIAATNFVKSYNSDTSRFPDMAADYFAEITVSELYNSPAHLCFELRQYLYTGGAHGYGTVSFLNIDPKTGNEMTDAELFKNKKDFTDFAALKFREQQGIKPNQSLNDTGFWFENNTFYLPESVGFNRDSLIFVYNQYDIASYADGAIELKIALSDAKPYLNEN